MILYHASTAYHVLCCIVHKLAYHKEEKATFMIVEHMQPKKELEAFITKLSSFSWFDEILSVPEGSFRLSHGKNLNQQSSEDDILEVISNICKEVDQWYPSGFQQFKEIYVASDQWAIGVYLLYHKFAHYYFEDASGMLGDTERYLTIVKEINMNNYVISNYLGGAGRSDLIIKKYCDVKNQPEGFYDEKTVDFSIYQIVSTLSVEQINDLILLYGAKRYQISSSDKVVLYMTQFLKTLTLKNLEVQERITTLLLDYFANDYSIIIKPHPKDRWIDYRRMLPRVIILDNSLPSELLPFVLEGDVNLVLTASSTSIGGMSHISKNIISFGTDIEVHYERLHRMYMAAKVINEVFYGQEIVTRNMIRSHIYNFLSMYSTDFSIQEPDHIIYIDGGQTMLEEARNYPYVMDPRVDILIFLNFNETYSFLTIPDLIPNNFIVLEDEFDKKNEIWIYCENEVERRKILSIKEIKSLNYTGIELEINSKEATTIKILNGKMKALQYVLKQKESEEQNQLLYKMKEMLKQYQEEDITKHILLEEEGIVYE